MPLGPERGRVRLPAARQASARAMAMQEAAYSFGCVGDPLCPIEVRTGFHGDDASEEERRVYGDAVCMARRLCGVAEAGQLYLGEATAVVIGDRKTR